MSFFSWFRWGRAAEDVATPAPAVPRPQDWSANQVPAFLEVARRLVKPAHVQAFAVAFRSDDRDYLRRELPLLAEKAYRTFGPEHSDTAAVLEQLGRCGRDPAETAKHLEPCLAIWARELGPTHPDTVRVQHFLGLCYQNLNQFDRAVTLLESSLSALDGAGRHDYYWMPQVLGCLGISYRQTGQFDKAEQIYLRCLRLAEAHAAKNPDNLLGSLSNLGGLYAQMGRHDESEAVLARAADLAQATPGLRWQPLAQTLHGVAAALEKAGARDRAEATYARCAQLCARHGTIPPPPPWEAQGGLMAALLRASGAPAEVARQFARNEDVMAAAMREVLGLGRPQEKRIDPPPGQAPTTPT